MASWYEKHGSVMRSERFIFAEICGFGMTTDISHMTAPEGYGGDVARAMRRALDFRAYSCPYPSYLNAHTGPRKNDPVETWAIKKVFKNRAYEIPLSPTKSMCPRGANLSLSTGQDKFRRISIRCAGLAQLPSLIMQTLHSSSGKIADTGGCRRRKFPAIHPEITFRFPSSQRCTRCGFAYGMHLPWHRTGTRPRPLPFHAILSNSINRTLSIGATHTRCVESSVT